MYERVSNIYYPPGSIVRIEATDEQLGGFCKFLYNRPLVVLSVQTQMFDSLLCIPCGSRERPGIEISLWDYNNNSWLSDRQFSTCFPYNAYTIRVNSIKDCLGHLDPWTFKAIKEAFLYHLGMSENVPSYMEEIHRELYEPHYVMGNDNNTQIGSKHYMISRQEARLRGIELDAPIPDPGQPHTHKPAPTGRILDVPYFENSSTVTNKECDAKECKHKLPPTPLPLDVPIQDSGASDKVLICPPGVNSDPKPHRKAYRRSRNTPNIDYDKLIDSLPISIQTQAIAGIISDEDAQAYGLPFQSRSSMAKLSTTIMQRAGAKSPDASEVITKLANRINHRDSNWKFLSDVERYIAIAYGTPDSLQTSQKYFDTQVISLCRKYGITYDWACTRRQIPNRMYIKNLLHKENQKKRF